MNNLLIGGIEVGPNSPPFVIAELSGNHNQNFDDAKNMILAASKAGVNAIKLQTYTADSMTLNHDSDEFVIQEKDSLWHGQSLHSLYQKAATPYEWHAPLFQYANELGLLAFSSPFDEGAVDFLDTLNVPCFKIASFELTDLPLIKKAASKGKPLIMSTGMATLSEIELALETARKAGCKDIILLKCTSTYPASPTNTNLKTIPNMRGAFGVQVGISDHTAGIGVSVAAVALGATVIEKHFVLDRDAGGVDAEFSLQPEEFTALVRESKAAWQAMGNIRYGGTASEEKSKQYRRSIYVAETIEKGDVLSEQNLKIIRPAFGLAPKHWSTVLGRVAKSRILKGTPLDWQIIE